MLVLFLIRSCLLACFPGRQSTSSTIVFHVVVYVVYTLSDCNEFFRLWSNGGQGFRFHERRDHVQIDKHICWRTWQWVRRQTITSTIRNWVSCRGQTLRKFWYNRTTHVSYVPFRNVKVRKHTTAFTQKSLSVVISGSVLVHNRCTFNSPDFARSWETIEKRNNTSTSVVDTLWP